VPVLQPQRSARALREEKPPKKTSPITKDPAGGPNGRLPHAQRAAAHSVSRGSRRAPTADRPGPRVQLSPDGRHRDVDHDAIQQCHPRTKDSRGNQPPRTRRRERQLAWLDIFTARGWFTPEDPAPKLRYGSGRGCSSIPAPITATGRLEKSGCNLKLIACWDVAIMLGNPVPASTKDQCGVPT
jgi:hypothetical protein